jgi:hypothetical protein
MCRELHKQNCGIHTDQGCYGLMHSFRRLGAATWWYQSSKRTQKRSRRASGTKGIVQLLLIILGATVVVVLGLYVGLASSHHH